MNTQKIPTVLIAYPPEFLCYEKFARKLSAILANFDQFCIAYIADDNNFINKQLSANKKENNIITSLADTDHLHNISHAIIFNDGESFNSLIDNAKHKGIKSRIIDIKITKVVNKDKGEKYDIYIGRGSRWGNPYAVGFGASIGEEQDDRNEAIRKYKYDFEKGFLKSSKKEYQQLKGKTLGCHCKPFACHGDVIAQYLNSLDDGK